ncbi:MAG: copper chaperone PCu(A)C [Acidobacteria bacterium]|nr:copper chaperone PCu(A)C [Acidobacteriota bacterium]
MRNVATGISVRVLAALLCLLTGPGLAAAQEKPVKASDGWVRPPAADETTTVAFASVENPGMYAIYLTSAISDAAGKVEFRDAGKGPQALEFVAVLPQDTTYMDPKGVHMYLSALKRPLKAGDTVSITLKTELGVEVQVSAVVKPE